MSDFPAPAPAYLGPPHRFSAGDNKPIVRIVLHGTVSAPVRGGARQTAAYFRGSSAAGSAHYVVDPGEVVQSAYDSVIAWHAPPNSHSLGIEFCDWVGQGGTALPLARWEEEDHAAMLARGARLVAQLCLAYDIPPVMLGPGAVRAGKRGICEHSDVSEAFHQSSHWDLGNFPRLHFQALVRHEIEQIKAAKDKGAAPVKAPPVVTNISRARELLALALRNARKKGSKRRIDKIVAGLDNLPRQ